MRYIWDARARNDSRGVKQGQTALGMLFLPHLWSAAPSMTIASIARHAAERPGAVAVINNGIAISYAELARAIGQFAQAVLALGPKPGAVVGIECRDHYLSLLLHLACERLGAGTFTISLSDLAGAVLPFR